MTVPAPILTFPDDYHLVRPADESAGRDERLGRFFTFEERSALCYARQPRTGHWMSFVEDPARLFIATDEDFAVRARPEPLSTRAAAARAGQAPLTYLQLHGIYRPEDAWQVWKAVALELLFRRHGPQWTSDEEKERFAERKLRFSFMAGTSPEQARRRWWRRHVQETDRPAAAKASQADSFRAPGAEDFSGLYDNVLIRHVRILRAHIEQVNERRESAYEKHIRPMHRRLQKMEKELARRDLDAE